MFGLVQFKTSLENSEDQLSLWNDTTSGYGHLKMLHCEAFLANATISRRNRLHRRRQKLKCSFVVLVFW